MKQVILLVAMVVLASGIAFTHGKEQRVIGTVTTVTDGFITVQTKAKDPVIVYTMGRHKVRTERRSRLDERPKRRRPRGHRCREDE
jgi:hypothetical protein